MKYLPKYSRGDWQYHLSQKKGHLDLRRRGGVDLDLGGVEEEKRRGLNLDLHGQIQRREALSESGEEIMLISSRTVGDCFDLRPEEDISSSKRKSDLLVEEEIRFIPIDLRLRRRTDLLSWEIGPNYHSGIFAALDLPARDTGKVKNDIMPLSVLYY